MTTPPQALATRRPELMAHLAQPLPFVMPAYKWWEAPCYGIGLKMYDALAGRAGLGRTEFLSRSETLAQLLMVQPEALKGGVTYWDGQFNDARLALARTAAAQGVLLVNYCRVTALSQMAGRIAGVVCEDQFSGQVFQLKGDWVINAAGVWADELRRQDTVGAGGDAVPATQPMVAPSQGVHMVVDRAFLGGDSALMVPKTADGRVLFAVPWLGKIISGTTDTPRDDLPREPEAFEEEIEFILSESAGYLQRAPTRTDVKSIWVGLRPLVKPPEDEGDNTRGLSEAMVRIAARHEYAITVEDVLARRPWLLFLDARLARELGGAVAEILQGETGQDPAQAEFENLCQQYLLCAQENP